MAFPQFKTAAVTIGNGAALSDAVRCDTMRPVAIIMPDAWTAADLTLQASVDGVTFADMYDASGAEITIDADASRYIQLDPAMLAGMVAIKLRSGTSGAAVNQAAERVLTLLMVPPPARGWA